MRRLPDLIIEGGRAKLIEREMVCYLVAETEAERRVREARGLPRPLVNHVVSRRVPVGPES